MAGSITGLDLGIMVEIIGILVLVLILGGGGQVLFKKLFGKNNNDNHRKLLATNSAYSKAQCEERRETCTAVHGGVLNTQKEFRETIKQLSDIQIKQGTIIEHHEKTLDKGTAMFEAIKESIGKIQQDVAGLVAQKVK